MDKQNGIFKVAVEALILDKDNNVLVTQRALEAIHHPGEWEITTGRLHSGENFIDALKREVREEVNIEVEVLHPFNTFHFFRGPEKEEHVGVSYLCRYKSGKIKLDRKEMVDFRWMKIDEAINLIKVESIKDDLRIVKNYIKNNLK